MKRICNDDDYDDITERVIVVEIVTVIGIATEKGR